MEILYSLLDPTGNLTILVETPVAVSAQPRVAALLMAQEPMAEQVGFLSPGGKGYDLALRMAGGEFCGNAAMSAAALLHLRNFLPDGICRVSVSGAERPVEVEVRGDGSDYACLCRVEMPRPLRIGEAFGAPLVEFPGISHQILTVPTSRAAAEAAVKERCAALGAEALGLMLLSRDGASLTPLVYVPGADTLCWESSCASGTAAVGAHFAAKYGAETTLSLREPGGVLRVTAAPDGAIFLAGRARICKMSLLDLPDAGETAISSEKKC